MGGGSTLVGRWDNPFALPPPHYHQVFCPNGTSHNEKGNKMCWRDTAPAVGLSNASLVLSFTMSCRVSCTHAMTQNYVWLVDETGEQKQTERTKHRTVLPGVWWQNLLSWEPMSATTRDETLAAGGGGWGGVPWHSNRARLDAAPTNYHGNFRRSLIGPITLFLGQHPMASAWG